MDDIIKEYLKNNLSIVIDTKYPSYERGRLEISLLLEGEVISKDFISLCYLHDDGSDEY